MLSETHRISLHASVSQELDAADLAMQLMLALMADATDTCLKSIQSFEATSKSGVLISCDSLTMNLHFRSLEPVKAACRIVTPNLILGESIQTPTSLTHMIW